MYVQYLLLAEQRSSIVTFHGSYPHSAKPCALQTLVAQPLDSNTDNLEVVPREGVHVSISVRKERKHCRIYVAGMDLVWQMTNSLEVGKRLSPSPLGLCLLSVFLPAFRTRAGGMYDALPIRP